MVQEALRTGVDLALAQKKGQVLAPCSDPLGKGKPCEYLRKMGCGQEDGLLQTPRGIECPLQRGVINVISE